MMKKTNYKGFTFFMSALTLAAILMVACQENEEIKGQPELSAEMKELVKEFNLVQINANSNTPINKFSSIEEAREALLIMKKGIVPFSKKKSFFKPSTHGRTKEETGDPQPCTVKKDGDQWVFTFDGFGSDFNVTFNPTNGQTGSSVTGLTLAVGYQETTSNWTAEGEIVTIKTHGTVTYGIEIQGAVVGYSHSVTVETSYNKETGTCTMKSQY
jgi:hypothetical protein